MAVTAARGFGLGRIPRFDEKSRAFPARTATSVRTCRHTVYGPRLDQGEVGSCTGNTQAAIQNTKPHHQAREAYKSQDDALRCYSMATARDPWPGTFLHPAGPGGQRGQDTGSSTLAACKAAQELGWIGTYTWAFGLDHMLASLMLGPVAVGVNWYESMFNPSATGYVEVAGDVVGGHAFMLHGLNMRDRYVWATNSWGLRWGLRGQFKVPLTLMGRLLREDGEAMRPEMVLAA